MENLAYMLAAYTIIWAAVFGYVLYIFMKQRQLRRDFDRLRETMGEEKNG
jgi:CcmD family protein